MKEAEKTVKLKFPQDVIKDDIAVYQAGKEYEFPAGPSADRWIKRGAIVVGSAEDVQASQEPQGQEPGLDDKNKTKDETKAGTKPTKGSKPQGKGSSKSGKGKDADDGDDDTADL